MSTTHATRGHASDRTGDGDGTQALMLGADDLLFLKQLDHDLRTPLGTMAAVIELLRAEPPGPLQADAVAVLERQLTRLHSLTASLHDFSQRLGR